MIKKLGILISMVSVVTVNVYAEGKRYDIESGIITYKTTISGAVLGIKQEGHGTGSLVFNDYGNVELSDEEFTNMTMGQNETSHTMSKIDNGKAYTVDFKHKTIIQLDNMGLSMGKNQDMTKIGKEMVQSMGGKKIGDEKFLGYNCEVWSVMGSKVWLYKGVTLKVEADMMGIKNVKEATKVEFDIKIDEAKLKLPDFKVKTLDSMMNETEEEVDDENSSKDTPSKDQMNDVMKQLGDLMKNFGGMPKE